MLFFNLGEKESEIAFKEMQSLRNNGISCELFYENVKMDKQFKYASKKNIPFAIIIGSRELEETNMRYKGSCKKRTNRPSGYKTFPHIFTYKQVTFFKICH